MERESSLGAYSELTVLPKFSNLKFLLMLKAEHNKAHLTDAVRNTYGFGHSYKPTSTHFKTSVQSGNGGGEGVYRLYLICQKYLKRRWHRRAKLETSPDPLAQLDTKRGPEKGTPTPFPDTRGQSDRHTFLQDT